MKKFATLLLILVLTVVLLCGLAAATDPYEKPLECSQAEAAIMVTHAKGDRETFYFETLEQQVIRWAAHELEGVKTITLLKDLELSNPESQSNVFLSIPEDSVSWFGRDGEKGFVFDLNGKTMRYEGAGNFFTMGRWAGTFKNGTMIYNATASRAVFTIGGSKTRTAFKDGTTSWKPVLKLEDLTIINESEESWGVVQSFVYDTSVIAKNCTIWTRGAIPFAIGMTNQSNIESDAKAWEGTYQPKIELINCIVGAGRTNVASAAEAGATLTVTDSVLVAPAGKNIVLNSKMTLDSKGQSVKEDANWSAELPVFGTVSGNAVIYGKAPSAPGVPGAADVQLPFTDVAEGSWYEPFVKELYNDKIISGMTETTFAPDGTLTYGQALKLIILGIGEAEQPAIAGGHWASGYLKLAKERGWLTTDVNLNDGITRLAFCRIAAKAKGLTETAENKFTDTEDVSVLALVQAGVINGMTETTFAPNNQLTRAQISKIISLLRRL